jgi:hypothetical protein
MFAYVMGDSVTVGRRWMPGRSKIAGRNYMPGRSQMAKGGCAEGRGAKRPLPEAPGPKLITTTITILV